MLKQGKAFPPSLTKKSHIFIWTPSSPAPFLFPKRFKRALRQVNDVGLTVTIGDSSKNNLLYDFNFEKAMIDELHSAFLDPQIDAIIFATGGWTTISLLKYIDWEIIKKNPKVIMGYSDATSLLLACYEKANLVTYHGPMIISEWGEYGGPSEYTLTNLFSVFEKREIKLSPPKYWTEEVLWWDKEDNRKRKFSKEAKWNYLKKGYCKGRIIGGNLPTISLLIGTEYFPELKGSVLFIEDQDCSPDKFLAYLTQLEMNGVFDDIVGLIIGRFAQPQKCANGFFDFNKMLKNILYNFNKPVLVDVDLGHTEPMITIPIGALAELDSENNTFSLIIGEG